MLLSFVIPETLLAVALLFLVTTIAVPFELGTTAQVVGLVTFQLSYPAVLVRARLATIGKQYEEAAQDLGASPLGALRRVILPMLDAGDLRQHRARLRRRDRRLRHRALPVRRLVHRTGVGEDLQHRPGRADAGAERAGHDPAGRGAARRRARLRRPTGCSTRGESHARDAASARSPARCERPALDARAASGH